MCVCPPPARGEEGAAGPGAAGASCPLVTRSPAESGGREGGRERAARSRGGCEPGRGRAVPPRAAPAGGGEAGWVLADA